MCRDIPTIEVMDDAMAEVLRQKSGVERLQIAWRMWSGVRKTLTNYLQTKHPQWDDAQIQHEVARRMSHGAV